MRAAFIVVVAHAVALTAALCTAAGSPEYATEVVLQALEAEESDCCGTKVADLISRLTALRADNIELQKTNERLAGELDECRAESVKQALVWRLAAKHDHSPELSTLATRKEPPAPPLAQIPAPRRRTLATPTPTPLTPIPTPFTPIPTTATPSATPSASPVPTTEGVTTHSQLAAAVADPANAIVVVEGDVKFPSLSAITVDSGRSVSVVGRSAVDGGRVVLDGDGHSQHFYVTGGTLHISFVNLVNGTTSVVEVNCRPDLWKCFGGSILVTEGGTLVMRSCDVRGGGPGRTMFGNANNAGGVMVNGDDSIGDFYNVSFIGLRSTNAAALYAQGSSGDEERVTKVRLFGCSFLRNSAKTASTILIGWTGITAEFYDCLFEKNDGLAIATWISGDLTFARCIFRMNSGTGASWPPYGSAFFFSSSPGSLTSISDSVFERNSGDASGSGASVTFESDARLTNVSFLANSAFSGDGGAALDIHGGAKVTAINCIAIGNVGPSFAGGFVVEGSELIAINSECQRFCRGKRQLRSREISHCPRNCSA